MEEYRKLREKHSLIEICKRPELSSEVTLQPIRRFELDAAIIFADILLPLEGMGVGFEFLHGEGPVIQRPVRTREDIGQIRVFDVEKELSYVLEALRLVREQLDPGIALLGFAGAPFTVASYMIEGGYSRSFQNTKVLMYRYPDQWKELMERVSGVTLSYLKAQIQAGAQAVQLFDSWIGSLGPDDYCRYVLPYSKKIFAGLKDQSVPLIHFGTGTATLLELMKEAGATVIGVDWRISLSEAWRRLGSEVALQGNLDPVALLGPKALIQEKVSAILDQVAGRPGHIFNLGHGILPETPVQNVDAVIRQVHEYSR